MARTQARIYTNFWIDEKVRALPVADAKLLYLYLATESNLSRCGVMPWHSRRIMRHLGPDFTMERLTAAAGALIDARMILLDQEEGEVLVRSLVRHDGVLNKPTMAVTMMNDLKNVASPILRRRVIAELVRYRREEPTLSGWKARGMDALLAEADPADIAEAAGVPQFAPNTVEVAAELGPLAPFTGAINVVDMDLDSTQDLRAVIAQMEQRAPSVEVHELDGVRHAGEGGTPESGRLYPDSERVVPQPRSTTASVMDESRPDATLDTYTYTSTSTSTSTSTGASGAAPRKRAETQKVTSRIPDPFPITDRMREWARTSVPLVDLDWQTQKFVNHFAASNAPTARKRDWSRAWMNWMMTAQEQAAGSGVARQGVNPATSTAASAGAGWGAGRKPVDWMGES